MKISELLLLSSCFSDVDMVETANDEKDTMIQPPTSQQKWWASALIGCVFFIIASAIFMQSLQYVSDLVSGPILYQNGGHSLIGLLVAAIIFTLIVRVILG